MGSLAINFGLLGGMVMVLATSRVALRFGAFPVWFAWVSIVVAVALGLNILYFVGLFIWPAWVLLASLLSLTRPIGAAVPKDRLVIEPGAPTSHPIA